MKLINKIFIIQLVFLPLVNYSQQQFTDSEISAALNNPDTKKIRPRVIAANQIELLKEGVLLIRLQNKQNTIAALKKVKRFKEADKVEYQQKELNLQYIQAFRSHFNFCKVYFFYSNQRGTAVVVFTRSNTKLVLQSCTLGCLSSVSMMKRL